MNLPWKRCPRSQKFQILYGSDKRPASHGSYPLVNNSLKSSLSFSLSSFLSFFFSNIWGRLNAPPPVYLRFLFQKAQRVPRGRSHDWHLPFKARDCMGVRRESLGRGGGGVSGRSVTCWLSSRFGRVTVTVSGFWCSAPTSHGSSAFTTW